MRRGKRSERVGEGWLLIDRVGELSDATGFKARSCLQVVGSTWLVQLKYEVEALVLRAYLTWPDLSVYYVELLALQVW